MYPLKVDPNFQNIQNRIFFTDFWPFFKLFKTVKFKIQNLGSGLPFKNSVWADSVLEIKVKR